MTVLHGGATQLPVGPRKSSGTYAKTTSWNDKDEVLLRHEVEIRYRDRTPPRSHDIQNPRDRVTLEEILVWALQHISKTPPRDEDWEDKFYAWYDRMVERNPVHLTYLEEYTLCGDVGEMPPLRTDIEQEVTCILCKAVFGSPETEISS